MGVGALDKCTHSLLEALNSKRLQKMAISDLVREQDLILLLGFGSINRDVLEGLGVFSGNSHSTNTHNKQADADPGCQENLQHHCAISLPTIAGTTFS